MSRGSAGGQALAAKVHPLYFKVIGRRGGRRSKRNELLRFAADQADPTIRQIWRERAEDYHDEWTGTRIIIDLWLPAVLEAEAEPPRKKKRSKRPPCIICGKRVKGQGPTCSIRCYKDLWNICSRPTCNKERLDDSDFCAEHQSRVDIPIK